MADDFNLKVYLDLKTQGLSGAVDDVEEYTEAVQKAKDAGEITEKQHEDLSRVIVKLRTEMSRATEDTDKYAEGFGGLVDKLTEAQTEFRKLAQEAAAGGSLDPLGDAAKKYGLTEEKARELLATEAARTANVVSESKKVVSSYKNEQDALESMYSSPALRYALYDVGRTATVATAAITALGASTVVASAQFESNFTRVERTLDDFSSGTVKQVREDLMQLTREVPLAFADVTEIAMLGNQLGIAGQDVAKFTETVAQFSAITGISVNETSLAFGQLGNLMGVAAQDYDRMGSAIALVGVNSAATEAQIISTARELAPVARAAGFSADQLVGLSGALASIRQPPERVRSATLQFFETLNKAVSGGGEELDAFARVVGVTSQELDSMVRNDRGPEIFRRFVETLNSVDSVEVTQALEALRISGLRTNPVFRALSDNVDLLDQTLSDANTGWKENAELTRQYGMVVDDLSSKWQIFLNSVMEFSAATGDVIAPAAAAVLDAATSMMNALSDFIDTPFGKAAVTVAAGMALIATAVLGTIGGLALAGATSAALQFTMRQLNIQSLTMSGIFRGLTATLRGYSVAAGGATASSNALKNAFILLGRSTIILGLIQLLITALYDLRGAGDFVIDMFVGIAQSVVAALRIIADAIGSIPGGGVFKDWARGLQTAHDELGNFTRDAHREWGNFADDMGWTKDEMDGLLKTLDKAPPALRDTGYAADDTGDSLDNLGGSAGGAADEIRTLIDYANDLSSVWDRAFDIRFSGTLTMDKITDTFISMREASEAAARSMRDLKAQIKGLESDLDIQKYFLSVAIKYEDWARAEAIQANIAKLQAELEGKTADLRKEQDKQNKTLNGNSKAAIDNRAAITDLVAKYQDHLKALAESGMSQEDLARETERLRQQFITQATQLGYNRNELKRYEAAFDDVRLAILAVPRNITVTANANPAIQALNEMRAAADRAKGAVQGLSSAANNLSSAAGFGTSDFADSVNRYAKIAELYSQIRRIQFRLNQLNPSNPANRSEMMSLENQLRNLQNLINRLRGYAGGGYTGPGGMNQVAGVVHAGEYVIPKRDVNQATGMPHADALGRLMMGARGGGMYAAARQVNSSAASFGHIASFGPMAVQQLAQAMAREISMNGKMVGQVISGTYADSNYEGAY